MKVLDFGLAKAFAPAPAGLFTQRRRLPTHHDAGNDAGGSMLGTAAYMAPEQARGNAVDKRADIWAFGCVLYEMLTGTRAFRRRGSHRHTGLSARARAGLDASAARRPPPGLALWLQRCLRKARKERVGDIHDVRLALDGAFEAPAVAPRSLLDQRSRWPRTLAVAVAALVIGAALAWLLMRVLAPPVSAPVMRSRYQLPPGRTFGNYVRQLIDVSPDGSEIVFQAGGRLFVRRLAELTAREMLYVAGPLAGSDAPFNASANPVFSPDGRSVVYYDGALKRIATGASTPVTLCAIDLPWGISWSGDSIILRPGPEGRHAGLGQWRLAGTAGGCLAE